MTEKGWKDEYQVMVDDCENRESRLTDWERGFISSLGERLASNGGLTTKQIDVLNNIWERVTAHG